MNRTLRDSRNIPLHHRRGLGFNNTKDNAGDDINLDDLFSKTRRSVSLASSDESDAVSVKLGRLSLGSVKPVKSGLDDLLSSADGGKHDYDWLLTPPGTPLVPSSDGSDNQKGLVAPRTGPPGRSLSTTKASRLSVSQSESNRSSKPTRSSSVTRASISSSQYSTYSNKSTSILNTSSASVSSYIRPSTPTRSSSMTRPSTPSSRPSLSRSTTPSKPRPSQTSSSIDKPRPSQSSRPSTPTSRPQISANMSSPAPRTTTSRPSTPTRRNSAPSLSPVSGPSTPGGRTLSNGRVGGSLSRPSSPGPRVRPTPQPIILPDFPHETPPNLRTSLPDRPISAGRSRPGSSVTAKGNIEPTNTSTVTRRQSSPVVSRGRLQEPSGRSRTPVKGHLSEPADPRRESPVRKPVKTSVDSTGFGRTISKKSLDMAIRHMDIRNGGNGVRPITGSNLFPHSIRSSNNKSQPVNGNLSMNGNGGYNDNMDHISRFSESVSSEEDKSQSSAKFNHIDIYESSRYDMILLKEDLKNANWLRGIDDKSDQGPIFDNGFELLPEPFDSL